MSDLSKKTLNPSGDTKNYIENYWTKRADAFAALRRQELHSEKYSQWQREIVQHLPPAKQLPMPSIRLFLTAALMSLLPEI